MDFTAKISKQIELGLLWVLRHRFVVWAALGIILVVMLGSAILSGNYTNDLGHMFPAHSISGNMYRVIAQSHLGDSVQLELDTGKPGGAMDILADVETLAESLAAIPSITAVDFKLSSGFGEAWTEIASALPLMTEAAILATADPRQAVQNARKTLMLPAAPVNLLRLDPFGWQGQRLRELHTFQQLAGMKISLQHPFMTDASASRLLLNLQINLGSESNAKRIAELFAQIRHTVAQHVPGVKLNLTSPLRHVMDNERSIRRDILQISLVSMLALLFLFFIVYRGALDAVWIPLLPFASSVIVTGLLAFIFDNICLFILGICGSIAGLAVDQGIHVYTAYTGDTRLRNLSGLFLPLLMSAATSALVFFMLAISGIYAYVQLGLFAGCTLLVNFVLSFFLLPTLLRRRPTLHVSFTHFAPQERTAWLIVSLWLLISLGALSVLPRIQFNFNLNAMDGSSAETLQHEQEFQQQWRRDDAGKMIVVTATDREKLLQACENLEPLMATGSRWFHPAKLWPSQGRREANLHGWRSPETTEKLRQLQDTLAQECQKAGLPAAFYDPFFLALRQGIAAGTDLPEPRLFKDVTTKLIRQHQDTVSTMFFFDQPLNQVEMATLLRQLNRIGGCALLSNEAFRVAASTDMRPLAGKILLPVCLALLCLLLPVYRSALKLLIIFLPGFTATLWFSGLVAASGSSLNLATCFGMIMLIGLVLDYGIFALHHVESRHDSTISTAILFSAITTLFTSGALLFAKHPVLFHTGLVLFSEILITALTALYIVPAFMVLCKKWKTGLGIVILGLLCFSTGCASIPRDAFPPRQLTPVEAASEWQAFQQAQSGKKTQILTLKIDILWYSFPLILVVQKEMENQRIAATGMLPSGAVVFAVTGSHGQETSKTVSEIVPPIARQKIFGTIYHDLCNIFFTSPDQWNFSALSKTPIRRRLPPGETQTLNGNPLRLVQKNQGAFPNRKWIVYYNDWEADLKNCQTIVYKNFSTGCTFTFHVPPPPPQPRECP